MAASWSSELDPVRYGCFELKTECSHCGHPLILNGPSQAPICDSCKNPVDLEDELWKSMLEGLEEQYYDLEWGQGGGSTTWTGGFDLDISFWRSRPRCASCNAELDTDSVQNGTDGEIPCPECDHMTATYPAPEWLSEVLPSATQIFGAEREGSETQPAELDSAGCTPPRAVMLTCNSCGGSSKITHESSRTVSCSYCKADLVLPAEVWRRYHKPRVVKPWFVRFEGFPEKMEDCWASPRNKWEEKVSEQRDARMFDRLIWPVWALGLASLVLYWVWAADLFSAWTAGSPLPLGGWRPIAFAATAAVASLLSFHVHGSKDREDNLTLSEAAMALLIPFLSPVIWVWLLFQFVRHHVIGAKEPRYLELAQFLVLAPVAGFTTLIVLFYGGTLSWLVELLS